MTTDDEQSLYTLRSEIFLLAFISKILHFKFLQWYLWSIFNVCPSFFSTTDFSSCLIFVENTSFALSNYFRIYFKTHLTVKLETRQSSFMYRKISVEKSSVTLSNQWIHMSEKSYKCSVWKSFPRSLNCILLKHLPGGFTFYQEEKFYMSQCHECQECVRRYSDLILAGSQMPAIL